MKPIIFFLLLSLSPSAWAETKVTRNEIASLHVSSVATTIASTNFGTTLGNACVTGSTLTITTVGGPLFIVGSGSYSGNAANQQVNISVVVNGAFVSNGIYSSNSYSLATVPVGWSFAYIHPIAAGTHWVCLTGAIQGGVLTLPRADISTPRFAVMELR